MAPRPAFGAGGASAFGNFNSSASSLSYLAKPVDTSSITDAHVVVNFKSLQKKDETTKAKALEELISYTEKHPFEKDGGVEDPILEAWQISFYPRVSIDNSRRVRELAHLLQSALLKSTRKRMEKHFLTIFPVWYAGRFDSSTAVGRAVTTGQSTFIPSPEKKAFFLTRCQAQVLRFSIDALKETADTLSDERSTTPEDAEAKYYRVINAAIMLVDTLLQVVPKEDRDKHVILYEEFYASDKIWDFINVADGQVSRAVSKFFLQTVEKCPDYIRDHQSRLRKIFINDGLKTAHLGSNVTFVNSLAVFTATFPDTWTPSPKDRKTPVSRLCSFLKKGSQNSGTEFWSSLPYLFLKIPSTVIAPTEAIEIMDCMRAGMANRNEKLSSRVAWDAYVKVAVKILASLGNECLEFTNKALLPAFPMALGPKLESSNWMMEGSPYKFLSSVFYVLMLGSSDDSRRALSETLSKISADLCAAIASSLPAVSHDYVESQETMSVQGRRWFSFVGVLQADSHYKQVPHDAIDRVSLDILEKCIHVLDARNFNPFGAAQVLAHGLEQTAIMKAEVPGLVDFLMKAGTKSVETILESRCRMEITSIINLVGGANSAMASSYKAIWTAWIQSLLGVSSQQLQNDKFDSICSLCSTVLGMELGSTNIELQNAVVDRCVEITISSDLTEVSQLKDLLELKILPDAALIKTLKKVFELTAKDTSDVLRALNIYDIISLHQSFIFQDPDLSLALNNQLLSMSEDVDQKHSAKVLDVHKRIFDDSDDEWKAKVIQHNLSTATPKSLSVKSMVKILGDSHGVNQGFDPEAIPDIALWIEEIRRFVNNVGLDPMLAVTSPIALASAQFIIEEGRGEVLELQRDRFGLSIPARMATFIVELEPADTNCLHNLDLRHTIKIFLCLALTHQVASDQLALDESDQLFMESNQELEDFVAKSGDVLKRLLLDLTMFGEFITEFLNVITGVSPFDYYVARALHQCMQWLDCLIPVDLVECLLESRKLLRPKPKNVLSALAVVGGARDYLTDSKQAETMLNRLLSEVQGLELGTPNVISTLCPLTALLCVFELGKAPVPPNRVTFAVRQLTTWLDGKPSDGELGEIMRVLSLLLPNIPDMYGTHWHDSLNAIVNFWNRRSRQLIDALWPMYTSLRLYNVLQNMAEANDDLEDALKEVAAMKNSGILKLLKADRDIDCEALEIVDELIARLATKIPADAITDYQELIGLLGSPFKSVYETALTLILRVLPSVQDQTNTDFIIEKKIPTLPSELIQVLNSKPVYEELTDDETLGLPAFIRGYLAGWMVVFEMYRLAQFDVRDVYTTQLQEANLFAPLFEFTFNTLGHVDGKALNLETRKITSNLIMSYDAVASTSDDENFVKQWLLTHVYFLCLKYAPGVFRKWYVDLSSKQTKMAIESWTGKYISPLIVDALLDEVKSWSAAQDSSGDDEQNLNVKISRNTNEISAGYEIDETEATILIKIPKSYPLGNVEVVGMNRVGVNEKKWQSWVRSTQGVIMFSNGSIIDGLVAFKRNMVGAMKGQSECAICYAIISTDKRMPDKRCGTCKHYFHKTCLYKWFQTSSQNSCPLCRNPIDYLGADSQVRRGGRDE
ncbi:hypothetical protein TD95_004567 [Thielaviopsis punctulata]|uniref:E3 ubiquitin-protein ligase listerin n=1 Tax=Thielaviopsis punctulata TaxID=72032 RepID=A0A0F4ZHQ7_9PEZI|nr:hypothetical protein TD95_004567 [Thielaviopsis punctulata]